MKIIKTHQHRLVFSIDKDAPTKYKNKWNELKTLCEIDYYVEGNELTRKDIFERIKEKCKLKQNKELPYLNRLEGGLGGNNNILNKQLRFRNYKLWSKDPRYVDNNIIIDKITNGKNEEWSYEELDDIIYGFIKMGNEIIEAECINGIIELKRM